MAAGVSFGSIAATSKDRSSRVRCCRAEGSALTRRDDLLEIEARLTLETEENERIHMTWKGLRHGPKEVIDRVNRGEIVDPGTYYFRTTPYFETGSEKYAWMNRICSIATGSRTAGGRTIHVFQVL